MSDSKFVQINIDNDNDNDNDISNNSKRVENSGGSSSGGRNESGNSDSTKSAALSEAQEFLLAQLTGSLVKSANLRSIADAKETQAALEMAERMQTVVDEEQIHQHNLESKQAKIKRRRQQVLIDAEKETVRAQRDARRRRREVFEAKMDQRDAMLERQQRKRERREERSRELEELGRPQRERDIEFSEHVLQLEHKDRMAKLDELYTHDSIMREADLEFANGSQRINADYAVRLAKLRQAMVELRNEARVIAAERQLKLTELAQSIANKYGAPLDEEYFE